MIIVKVEINDLNPKLFDAQILVYYNSEIIQMCKVVLPVMPLGDFGWQQE